jgi:uncharacterized protein YecE (DUF72 family)
VAKTRGTFRIGTSGYQYNHWRGVLYPDDVPKKRWFEVYADTFNTVEINNTFYHLPKAETFDDWRRRAPDGFLYVLKYSRYGTHMKRLKDPGGPDGHVATFLERADRLGPLLGPILVQLPPHWNADPARLDAFLAAAPADHRWAVEFRDPSWFCEAVWEVLRRHNAALVVHDMLQDHPREVTADWVYLRFHGTAEAMPYGGNYSPQALSGAARRIRRHLGEGRDVFAFFNNDAEGHAVRDALALRRYVRKHEA